MHFNTLDSNLLIGKKFYNWTVLQYFPGSREKGKDRNQKVLVLCDCGNIKKCSLHGIYNGKSKSCGCLVREDKHELSYTSEYFTWVSMRFRCSNKNHVSYKYYGGRNISVCERWNKFSNFISDMGMKPDPSYSLDRINNDGNYEPNNCRWASAKEQAANRRPNNSDKV
jgi:hypothetical protein